MKIVNSFIFVFCVTCIFAGTNILSVDDTPIALIKKIIKDVTYRNDDASDWEIAKTGIPLADGQEVKTGFKSLALILFTDGSGLLRVRENSILHIYGEKEDDRVSKNTFIQKGKLGFEINKQENEEFKFTTPTVVASIRGTSGYFDIEGDSSTTVVCETGLIELQASAGLKQSGSLSAGNAANINKNGEINFGTITNDQQDQLDQTKKTKTKKIKIDTKNGVIEIEYLQDENK